MTETVTRIQGITPCVVYEYDLSAGESKIVQGPPAFSTLLVVPTSGATATVQLCFEPTLTVWNTWQFGSVTETTLPYVLIGKASGIKFSTATQGCKFYLTT